jgi:hypothetical protein
MLVTAPIVVKVRRAAVLLMHMMDVSGPKAVIVFGSAIRSLRAGARWWDGPP